MSRTLLDKDLQAIDMQVVQLGSLVETALTRTMQALATNDQTLSGKVVTSDKTINDLKASIEQHSLRILTLQQPLGARDLRYLTSLLPITIDLERVGDYADEIAQLVLRMLPLQSVSTASEQTTEPENENTITRDILDLGQQISTLLHQSMQSFEKRDAEAARDLWHRHSIIDKHCYRIRNSIISIMEGTQAIEMAQHDAHKLQRLTYMFWIVNKLERIFGHCKNICQRTVFIVQGTNDLQSLSA